MTTIELHTQMKALRNQQKLAQKQFNKVKKDYNTFKQLIRDNIAFEYAIKFQYSYGSFYEMVDDNEWKNEYMDKSQFEILYNALNFKDVDFFRAFMSFDKQRVLNLETEDKKCPVCFNEYKFSRPYYKFTNCTHMCCIKCYGRLPKINGNKCCVICRQTET